MAEQEQTPQYVKELLTAMQELDGRMKELQEQQNKQQNKFNFSDAVSDWIAEKKRQREPGEAMDDVYRQRHEVDVKGFPVQKPKFEIPDELLEKAKGIGKNHIRNIERIRSKNNLDGDVT